MDHASAAWMLGGIIVLLLVAATLVTAQELALRGRRSEALAQYRNRLLGAYDEQSGAPLEGVEVLDVMSGSSAVTTKMGTVALSFLPDGGSLVRLRKVGYAPFTLTVAISPTDTAPFTILMRRSPQDRPTVVTLVSAPRYLSPGLHGFEERMRAGLGGQFVSEATLRSMDGEVLSSVLRRFHGAVLKRGRFVSTRKTSAGVPGRSNGHGGNGFVAVYENGIQRASLAGIDFDKVSVDDYAAVEFYAGAETYPVWISPTNNDCGVLLLWTRER